MRKFLKILILVIVVAFIAFLGIHYLFSGQFPLQLCTNCHGT
jgi:hypothetical protein